MADIGGYVWFIGLGACLIVLALAIAISSRRKPTGVGDPNRAWKEEAAASGHPEVAKPTIDAPPADLPGPR